MRIVVLDGHALNPGDMDWGEFRAFGDLTVHERTPHERLLERAVDAEILIVNKTVLSRETIAQLPELRYIGVLATGYNVVDVAACREKNIVVTNVPAYGADSVAQLVFAHLLELARGAGSHARGVREGKWSASADFAYWESPQMELTGKIFGIVGYGMIGRASARIAKAFGMQVVAAVSSTNVPADETRRVSLDVLFHTSDFISLHCPLTDATRHLVNAERLALMKPSAYLINTSRGGVVDEQALAAALNSGMIAGAGLDVLSVEPPSSNNPLLTAKNCLITPHIAWTTREARTRLMHVAAENVRAFLSGAEANRV